MSLESSADAQTRILGFKDGFAVFQQHFDDLAQILLKLVQSISLTVHARPSGNGTDEKAGIGIAL